MLCDDPTSSMCDDPTSASMAKKMAGRSFFFGT